MIYLIAFYIRPDKRRLHSVLELMKKKMKYNSEVKSYTMNKEELELYLSKYKLIK
jgi:hypothetical protein